MTKFFEDLLESVQEMDGILRGEKQASRVFEVDPGAIKELRETTGLSQSKFALLLDVDVGTLRNWEQGRRAPTGPARALLRAIRKDPRHVLAALA
ncbi:MAG: helix-turn-helix domain-containing protein [Luteibacter sp.]|jgi:putative transcriptional regulator|uniref:helix-turn-helix domain-containing protein n=1 Tax=unclassified Luteibacter TaxID=2620188 RepID=UPI0005BBB36F|nr:MULTISPECIES: helix-turn-helix domain-containing protein [unclassified Luteibacter]MDQ7997449.1 helix-turn-helix domain-containing protein [Luteibacter sp.]MDQ8048379.1 helix-turn-helix domain-containing protein [Luteibacter sp.]MDR6643716.1 putative transcriptional regulator [Luteibacter sp. 1214]